MTIFCYVTFLSGPSDSVTLSLFNIYYFGIVGVILFLSMGAFLVRITWERMCRGAWGSGVVDIIILHLILYYIPLVPINQLNLKTYAPSFWSTNLTTSTVMAL